MWNIQGLFETINGSKHCKIDSDEFRNIAEKLDILCLQETHCGPKDMENVALPGYTCKHFNRAKSGNNRYFGGILLIYRNYISKGIQILDHKHPDKLWIKLKKTFFGFGCDHLHLAVAL